MLEMLIGLNVIDDQGYARYRKEMTPLLEGVAGGFGYDFKISETLKSESNHDVNRLFTIFFPNKEVMDNFFKNEHYLSIRKNHFKSSVHSSTIIATYIK